MRRRVAAPLLVLLALVAVVAVAVVPRGLVRATAAQHLPSAALDGDQITADDDGVRLPGVRAVVGKEEDDGAALAAPGDAVGRVEATPTVDDAAAPPGPAHLAPPLPVEPGAGAPAPGRAPPLTV